MGSAKGGSQTIGYKYFMSILMGIGRGAMSEMVEIKVGGKTAWRGPACGDGADSQIWINAPDLFGGDEKEGGILGPAQIHWGEPDQVLPGGQQTVGGFLPGIKETISAEQPDAKVPALRGVTTFWFDGEVCSLNPYPKEWKFRMRRHIHGWYGGIPWYPAKNVIYMSGPEVVTAKRAAALSIEDVFAAKGGTKKNAIVATIPGNIKASNGAHIIYECVTNPEWGRGEYPSALDENSFIYAANQLCSEGFGLCFFWTRQEDVDVFIQTVLDHIGGVLYTDRSTGLLTLRLIRSDYTDDTLPTFSPGRGLLDILVDDSGSQDIAYNEVVVKYHDPISDVDGEARAHNAGARVAQGATNSITKEYPGLPTKELAGRVAVRELIVQSAGLKKYKVRLDRSAWRIAPGMPFRIQCPERGIANIILRAGEITDASIQQGGYIEIGALEDVFSMPATSMVVPEDSTWTPPVGDPVEPDASEAFELSYYDMTKRLSEFDVASINDADAYFGMVAAQPLATQQQYDLKVDDDGDDVFTTAGTFSFTANARLAAAIGPLDTVLTLEAEEHWPDDVLRDSVSIGGERMRIDQYDPATHTLTVARGVIDTLPQRHAKGAQVWLPDDDIASNRVTYSEGETIDAAAATRSTTGVLPEEEWEVKSVTLRGRVGRPYPVADLKVDGVSVYLADGEHEAPVLTWVPRNRVTQQDQLVGHTEGPVAEEAGTTYEVEVKTPAGVLISTHPLPGGTTTFTYDAALQATDGSPDTVRFNVVTIRDGYRSLNSYDVSVVIIGGWDYGWGMNWGA